MDPIAGEIRDFVISNFLFGQDDGRLTQTQSLLESGIIDSTGVLELIGFLEQRFEITVGDREMLPENLDSIINAARFVKTKLEQKGTGVVG